MNPATQVPLTLSLSADVGDGVWLDLAWGGGLGQLPASLGALSSCEVPLPLHPWTCGSWVSHWPGRSGTEKDCFNGQGSYLFGRDKVCERSLIPGKHLSLVKLCAMMVRTVTTPSPWLYWEVSVAATAGVISEDGDPLAGAARLLAQAGVWT